MTAILAGMVLDIERHEELFAYLRRTGRIAADEMPAAMTLRGGVSNRTVFVERADGQAWVLKQALAKLRVQADWFSDPRRIEREALGIRWLARFAPAGAITPLVFEDPQHHLLAMQAVPQPHENWKSMLLDGQIEDDHVRQFGTLLACVHRATSHHAEVARAFDDRSFFESLRLEPYYAYTATQVPEAAPFLHTLIADTRARRLALVHGDYSPKNILVHHGQLVLLDHEVIHFGDPAFDLGFSMTHLLSKAHHVADQRAAFARATSLYWRTYQQELGDVAWATELEARAVRHTLGCLLARVAGRSPLEYMDEDERARQRAAVVALLAQPPASIAALSERFLANL